MDCIEGVILGAGLSRRARTLKMLLDLGGLTLIERCIMGMYDLCFRIIVVVGHEQEKISKIIEHYEKVYIVQNPNYLEGMFSSVKVGFGEVRGERFFFIPGDYPLIKEETYKRMLEANGDIVIPLFYGQRGHPLLIKSELIPSLIENKGYQTLRDFVKDIGYTGVEVEDPGILMDVDTLEDYKKVTKIFYGK